MKKPHRRQRSYSIIYGAHPIIECIKAGKRTILEVYTTKPTPKVWGRVSSLLPSHVPVRYVTRDKLSGIAQTGDHRGIVAKVTSFTFQKTMFNSATHPNIVLLDGVQDVRNVGAILRTAYCVGVDGIIMCQRRGAPLSSAVFYTSAGLAEYLSIYRTSSISHVVNEIRDAGYTLYVSTLDGTSILEASFTLPMCMVIGNEETGVSPLLYKKGVKVTIPQVQHDISYNASVAAGILLFTAQHRVS